MENSSIQPIYDIGPVVPDDHYGFDVGNINIGKLADQLQDVKVVGVIYLDDHKKCIKCASKVAGVTDDPEIGKCSKCVMLQCIEACQSSVTSRLMIKSTSDSGMPLDIVMTTQNDSVTSLSLLKAPLFNVSFRMEYPLIELAFLDSISLKVFLSKTTILYIQFFFQVCQYQYHHYSVSFQISSTSNHFT